MDYKIIRSGRKTLSIEITRELELVVRAPNRASREAIEKFVVKNEKWIDEHMKRAKARAEAHPEPSEEERERYIKMAKAYLPERVAYFAELMGVKPMGITVTGAQTRFGSCSGKNRLSFSWRIMAYPPELVDYVIVHELAHIKHHDHSAAFYAFIATVMPDHEKRRKKLKE